MVFEQIQDDIEKGASKDAPHFGYVAGADILAGQVVKITGDNEVSPSDTDGETVFGVATQSVAEGDTVNVLSHGTKANVRATDAIDSATDPLVTSNGATGDEGEVTTAAGGDFVLGQVTEDIPAGGYGQVLITLGGEVNA